MSSRSRNVLSYGVVLSSKSFINQLFKEDTADVLPKSIKIDVPSLPMRNSYTGDRGPR